MNNQQAWSESLKGLCLRASYLCTVDSVRNRSAVDHMVRFDNYICNAFAKKEHVNAIFCDLEKLMTPRADTVYYYLIFTTMIFEAICLPLSMSFYPTDCSR